MKKNQMGIKQKLILLVIVPALLVSATLMILAIYSLNTGMKARSEDAMVYLAEGVRGGYDLMEGDYSLDESGNLLKGEENLSEQHSRIDAFIGER